MPVIWINPLFAFNFGWSTHKLLAAEFNHYSVQFSSIQIGRSVNNNNFIGKAK